MDVAAYSAEAALMAVRVGDAVYVLDKDDIAKIAAVVVRLLAEGRRVDPAILPALLGRGA